MIKFSVIFYAITDKFMLVTFVTYIFVTLVMYLYYKKNSIMKYKKLPAWRRYCNRIT